MRFLFMTLVATSLTGCDNPTIVGASSQSVRDSSEKEADRSDRDADGTTGDKKPGALNSGEADPAALAGELDKDTQTPPSHVVPLSEIQRSVQITTWSFLMGYTAPSSTGAALGTAVDDRRRVMEFAMSVGEELARTHDVRLVALGAEKSSCAALMARPTRSTNPSKRFVVAGDSCSNGIELDALAYSRATFASCRAPQAANAPVSAACELFAADAPNGENLNPFARDAQGALQALARSGFDANADAIVLHILAPNGPELALFAPGVTLSPGLLHVSGDPSLVTVAAVSKGPDCSSAEASAPPFASLLRAASQGVTLGLGCKTWIEASKQLVRRLIASTFKPVTLPEPLRASTVKKVRVDGIIVPPASYQYEAGVLRIVEALPPPIGKGQIEIFL